MDYDINISKYNPLVSSSYIKLPKELKHLKKELINIQNTDDNKYIKQWLVRSLHPADDHLARIRKSDRLVGN